MYSGDHGMIDEEDILAALILESLFMLHPWKDLGVPPPAGAIATKRIKRYGNRRAAIIDSENRLHHALIDMELRTIKFYLRSTNSHFDGAHQAMERLNGSIPPFWSEDYNERHDRLYDYLHDINQLITCAMAEVGELLQE
jgi:hypothetical protein